MKREDVLKLFPEATPGQLKTLLDINCDDVEKAKGKLTTAEAELKQANETISTMTEEIQALKETGGTAEEYKNKLEQLQQDIAAKEEQAKTEAADKELTDKIIAVFPQDKQFTSDYVKNGLVSDIKAKFAEDSTKGLQAIFNELTQDKEGIFASQNPPGQMSGMSGADVAVSEDTLRAAMGLSAENK